MAVNKVYPNAEAALAGLMHDDMVIMSGGFGLCGIPSALIEAIRASGVKGLTIISNNAGIDDAGLGIVFHGERVADVTSHPAFAEPIQRIAERYEAAREAPDSRATSRSSAAPTAHNTFMMRKPAHVHPRRRCTASKSRDSRCCSRGRLNTSSACSAASRSTMPSACRRRANSSRYCSTVIVRADGCCEAMLDYRAPV